MKYKIIQITFLLLVLVLTTISYLDKFEITNPFGIGIYLVTGQSMEPSIQKGDILFTRFINISELKIGDVVTFESPYQLGHKITHRLVDIDINDDVPLYLTKGDANLSVDPWYLSDEIVKGKLLWRVPLVGYAISFLRSTVGWILLIIIPIGYLIYKEIEVIKSEVIDIYDKNLRNRFRKLKWMFRYGNNLISKTNR